MSSDLVSCFLPIFNAEGHLADWWSKNGPELRAVDATLVVIDNGSSDGSVSLIEGFGYCKTRIVRHGENLGLEQSFRSAKALISSKYRFFLPADDWLAPGYLGEALDVLESDAEVGVVYGKSYTVDIASATVNERFRPSRPVGSRRESPFSTILFSNYIPDISLYRSCYLDCEPSSADWFPPGAQSAVLARSKVFYTGRGQCFSGKSVGQVSQEWGRSGRYYSELERLRVGARSICCDSLSSELLWYLIEANFHTGKGFVELLQMCIEGAHPYVQAAIKNSREDLMVRIASSLADELIVDAVSKTVRRIGRYGSVNDLRLLVKSLSGEARKVLATELCEKGLGGVVT